MTGEFPFEGPRCCLPVILKIQQAFGDGVEIGKIVRVRAFRGTMEK